jgi:tRNA A-37 threonylcarbamoyl transferase component Bud32
MGLGWFGTDRNRTGHGSPPEDFLEIRKAGVVAWVRKGFSFLLDEDGMWRADRAFCPADGALPYTGRGTVLRLSLGPMAESCAVVRHYRRGGIMGPFLRDYYLGQGRFFREVRVSEWARSHGVPTAEVLAMRSERRGLCLHRGDLITREIAQSEDLDRYLGLLREKEGTRRSRRKEVIRSIAFLLQGMHRVGLYHADLNLKNIVIQMTEGGVNSYVIDLDRARVIRPLGSRPRIRNLVRLYRSLEKQGYLDGVIETKDLLGFIKAYCGEDRELLRLCKEVMRRDMLLLRYHRAGWRLSTGLRKMGGGDG